MATQTVSAEIEARPGQERRAAAVLQELGFRIHHIGSTISADGPAELWNQHFGVSFSVASKEIGHAHVTGWLRPAPDALAIPTGLRDLVAGVSFVEPPELY
jgi:hypothetical protein